MSAATRAMGILLTALVATSAAAPVARADGSHLRDARQQLDALDYEGALRALERGLQAGKSSPADLAELHRLLGEVHAALGRPARAEEHFRALLSLVPDASLAAGSSPKLAKPFDAARRSLRDRGHLDVRCDGDAGSLILFVDADPAGLVAGARAVVQVHGREQTVNVRGRGSIVLVLPPGARGQVVCAAIDAHGNRLVELRVALPATAQPAPRPEAAAPARDSASPGRPLYARWYIWGGLAAASGGASAYFGLQARADQRELDRIIAASSEYYYTEAQAVEQRGRRNALLANVGAGVAGACALVGAILLVRGDPAGRPSALSVAPLPVPQGAGVSLGLSF